MSDRGKGLTRRDILKAGGAIVGAGAVGGLLAACGKAAAPAAPAAAPAAPAITVGGGEVEIGFLWPLTGASAPFAEHASNAFKLVFDEVNAAGGIKSLGGAKLKPVLHDTQTKVDVASVEAEKLAAAKVPIIIGSVQSAAGVVIAPICERNKVAYLTPMDAVDSLTEQGYQYFFRVCLPISGYAHDLIAAIAWLSESTGKKPRKIAALHEDSVVGTKAAEVMLAEVERLKLAQVGDNLAYPLATTNDFTLMISKLKAAGADLAVQLSYAQDAILITKAMKELGYQPMIVAGVVGGHVDPGYVKGLGKLADYAIDAAFYAPDIKTPNNDRINGKYKQLYGIDMDSFAAVSVCTAGVVVDALERAGSTDRQKVAAALRATDIKVGESPYYIIPDGCKFDAKGQNTRQKAVVIQIQGGNQRSIWPSEFAAAKPVWPQPAWDAR